MTNVNKKIALFICLVLSLLMIFVLSSCYNGETPADSSINTDASTDSSTDTGTDSGTKEPEKCTVTFDSNGGTEVSVQSVEMNKKATEPTAPTRAGYTFNGWYMGEEKWSFIGYVVTEDMTLVAKWTANENTLSFNANGGEGAMVNETVATDRQVNLTANAFVRTGYTFMGWSTTASGAVEYIDGASYTMDACDTTLYAVWQAISYDITYELNGGTNNEENPSTYNIEQSFELESPTKDGYTFAGWYSDNSFNNNVTEIAQGTTGEKSFYAKWDANENTIVFNSNGGSGTMSNMTASTDTSVNLASNVFTKDGYTFKGWATTASGGVEYTDGASYTMGTNSSYTLYAVWEANQNTIVFNANGGNGTMENMTIATDSQANLTTNTFVKAGYSFIGWATTADGDVSYADEASYIMGTNSSYTLYAVWETVDYSITYVLNGGTNNTNSTTYTVEQEFALKDPSRAGYTFDGWYSDSAFNNKATGISLGTTGNKTFYAKWTVNENTLVFNANGGSGTMQNMTIATDSIVNLTANSFAKPGYAFKGWSTSASGIVEYADGASYVMGTNSTYTLYAVWEIIEYSITYDLILDGVDNSLNAALTYTVEDTITLKVPTKEYYDFLGWYTEASFENKIDKIENLTGNITLYAKWATNDTALIFTEAEGGYSVTGCVADKDVVIIPEIYNGSPVTSIGSSAFYNCTSLESITIPSSVTTVGDGAFYRCTSLTSITVDENNTAYKSIDGVLYSKDGTTLICYPAGKQNASFSIPNSVTTIGYSAFYNCTSLTSITIPNSVTSIGNYAFSGCTSLSSITIPNSVTSIGKWAFEDCTSLTSITIGDSVTSIGGTAFYNCTSLTSVNYLGTIEQWCNISFCYNTANPLCYAKKLYLNGELVTDLVIPSTVTNIKADAFFGCTSLTSVNYLGTIEQWCNISFDSVDANPLRYAKKLYLNGVLVTDLVIPSTVTKINNYAFSGCTSLTSVEIPSSITSIGDDSFRSCTSLTSIEIPSSVTTVGGRAFWGCTSLTSVEIPSSVTSIGSYAFRDCTSLTSVNYLGTIEQWCNISFDDINANPLCYAKKLYLNGELVTDIVIPSTVTKINNYAFSGCTTLANVTIPNSVTSIGEHAFDDCTSLESITIPSSVTTIGDCAFWGCTSLTSVEIPSSVTSIGDCTFWSCTSLTSVEIPSSVTSIGDYAFLCCTSLTSITIPNSITSIGEEAFYRCTSLTSVTIPSSVTTIVYSAFADCTSLTSVNYLGTIEQWCNISFDDINANPLFYAKKLYLNGELVTDIVIPSTVTKINNYAFVCCTSLTSVTIPNSVTSIGSAAFWGCTSLTIYCEATEQPNGWDSDWNYSNCPVVWGHTHAYTDGSCVCGATEI